MSSVFRKLISKELGECNYHKYFRCYQKLIEEKKYNSKELKNEEIYNDIYEKLKENEVSDLQARLERLLGAMCEALGINKNYVFAVIFYLVSVTFIIAQGLVPFVTIIAIGAMSICFLYKTYEFVVNKYCYIDAHIIIVYKEVLDQLLIQKGVVKQE